MKLIIEMIILILNFYMYLVIAHIIISWLFVFNVINGRNQFVAMIAEFLYKITEPVLGRIRRYMPDLGGIDLSPIVLFFAIIFIQRALIYYVHPAMPF